MYLGLACPSTIEAREIHGNAKCKGALGERLPSKAVCPNPGSLGEFLQQWLEGRVPDEIWVCRGASLVAQLVKNLPVMQEIWD